MPTVSTVARVFGVVARCLLVQVKRAHLQVHNDTLAPDMAWVRFKAVFCVCVHMCACVCVCVCVASTVNETLSSRDTS